MTRKIRSRNSQKTLAGSGKRYRPCEKDKFDLSSAAPLKLKVYFSTRLSSKVACLCAKSRRFACVRRNEHLLWIYPHRRPLVFFNALSGKRGSFHWTLEEFSTHGMVGEPRKKLKFERYLGLVFSFLQEFFCNLRQALKKRTN